MSEYRYLGNFAACEPWAAQGMSCDDCMVSWTGCWDNFQCPKCGKGELPNCNFPGAAFAEHLPRHEADVHSAGTPNRELDSPDRGQSQSNGQQDLVSPNQ